MTEIAATAAHSMSAAESAAARRLRKRYAAEWRFRAYGVAALIIAALFIVALLSDVVVKSVSAFTQTRVTLDVPVSAETIDPEGKRDPQTLLTADYTALLRDALREKFPTVTSRNDRRALNGLLSSGASEDLQKRVVADPALIGTTVKTTALLSDDADLFVKGRVTAIETEQGTGSATVSGMDGDVTIVSTNKDFADALASVKRSLASQASALLAEADRVADNARSTTGDEKTALDAKIAELRAQVAVLNARFAAAGAPESVDAEEPTTLVKINGGVVRATEISATEIKGTTMVPLTSADAAAAGTWKIETLAVPEASRRVSDQEAVFLSVLSDQGLIAKNFNWSFFSRGDSREPELAGVLGGLVGSLLTMFVTLVLSLPIGVLAAIYLEEFAPKNRWTEFVEVNINNLAAVPSIVFGLLGLAVFLNFFGMPRSAPIVGGLVIALMALPTIIIASRAAIRAVPPSIREAALGVGASHQQAVFHHVLPLAMPGIMTGTIIAMAHSLGETAPLIMIGMVAFVVDIPSGFTQAASVLPVQIFSWADLPEIAFQAKTAAAILVLLVFLFLMNAVAIVLRRRFERRW
ncbi:MAG: phosphate ABC transporter permease PstA [Proteobacteria bacterium]|nr:phosphate ABC transporter permease PstA [Pseudomonadota bacterium]